MRTFIINKNQCFEAEVVVTTEFEKERFGFMVCPSDNRRPLCYFEYSYTSECLYKFVPIEYTYDNREIYDEYYIKKTIEAMRDLIK